MTLSQQSTVIFVHSTAHWEAIQQQRAQLLGLIPPSDHASSSTSSSSPSSPSPLQHQKKERKHSSSAAASSVKRLNIRKEGGRRRNRWTNNNFSEHPQAVLYAEDLRPPGYDYKYRDTTKATDILIKEKEKEVIKEEEDKPVIPTILNRHIRHDLKKVHISQGLVSNYESQLIQFIDTWLDNVQDLSKVCLEIQVVSNNQFERYVLHTMSQYYGFNSFSKTNDQNNRITYIFHPAYIDYITKNNQDTIDYRHAENWEMPEKSFFDYLFHK